MEKQYAFFHTAAGCLTAVSGIAVACVGFWLSIFVLPAWWMQAAIALALCAITFWLADRAERRALRRRSR